jgi:hypothetical protein
VIERRVQDSQPPILVSHGPVMRRGCDQVQPKQGSGERRVLRFDRRSDHTL